MIVLRKLLFISLFCGLCPVLFGQNQTTNLSPVIIGGNLPYQINVSVYDMGSSSPPAIQSYVSAQIGNEWLLLAGRTNGLHNFSNNGLTNFPPAAQNTTAYVINPVTKEVWGRSLNDSFAGLTTNQVDSLSSTAPQSYQNGNTLYVAGGYVYNRTINDFNTFDTLTAIDVAQTMAWVKGGAGILASNIRQTNDALFQVTGGDLKLMNGRTHLIFGQNFDGPYTPGSNGIYTKQVRSFDVVDNGVSLGFTNVTMTTADDNYRRRDLNIVPIRTNGGANEGVVALSGVFNTNGGVWTVPVEISTNGTPSMADPTAITTFKQGMNNYRTATASLYSGSRDESHTLLFGGISLEYYDTLTGLIVQDDNVPFINSNSSIIRDGSGNYTQYYLGEMPSIANAMNGGSNFLFGASSDFMPVAGLPTLSNGMIDMDALTAPTVIGYMFGGIAATQPNNGSSGASDVMFAITFIPVPEPRTSIFILLVIPCLIWLLRRGKEYRCATGAHSQSGHYPSGRV
ncbi:MAG: hypothetical protein SGI98_00605 [Verrucomicrobiota bacterium]|nr:hypothetical protein [Verrucomicrobiota bacterium]